MECNLLSLFHFAGLLGKLAPWLESVPNWRFPPRESTADRGLRVNACASLAITHPQGRRSPQRPRITTFRQAC